MTKHLTLALAVAVGVIFAQGAVAADYKGPGFTGVAYFAENNATPEKLGNVYVDPAGFRMNLKTQGQTISSIIFWNNEIVISLIHDQKMYMELPPDQSGWEAYEDKPCNGYSDGRKLADETLGERRVEKWRCTGQISPPAGQAPSDATTWYDHELEMEIKVAEDNGNIFEIRNVKIGRQDASLYKIPDGYQKFDMNAMMQQMMQQQQKQ